MGKQKKDKPLPPDDGPWEARNRHLEDSVPITSLWQVSDPLFGR
jgi:hypothetical protein